MPERSREQERPMRGKGQTAMTRRFSSAPVCGHHSTRLGSTSRNPYPLQPVQKACGPQDSRGSGAMNLSLVRWLSQGTTWPMRWKTSENGPGDDRTKGHLPWVYAWRCAGKADDRRRVLRRTRRVRAPMGTRGVLQPLSRSAGVASSSHGLSSLPPRPGLRREPAQLTRRAGRRLSRRAYPSRSVTVASTPWAAQ